MSLDRVQTDDAAKAVRALAKPKSRSWSVPVAMIDPQLSVHRYTRTSDGLVQHFCEEELHEQEDPQQWERGAAVAAAGEPLELPGQRAVEVGVAAELAGTFDEFKAHFGLEDDPLRAESGWADELIEALSSDAVTTFLLIIGGAALYVELQMPGIGLGGLISALCFLLYFWAKFLGGTAGWLEVMMFASGVVLLLMELIVLPGFGLFGLTGGLLVIGSLVLASQTFVLPHNSYQFGETSNSILMLGLAGIGVAAVAVLIHRWLPRAPLFRSMVLAPPEDVERQRIQQTLGRHQHLSGARGTAISKLTPSGKARFGGEVVDVITDGEPIDEGSEIVVTEIRGSQVRVRGVA
jgi:hypothetical protein